MHQFPNRDAYDDFYTIMEQFVDIGVASFKEFAVKALLSYLRTQVNDESAAWFESYWSGPRGRYCLCDAGYAGTNNNMGMEVDWRDIKEQVPHTASLGTFIGALWQFIKQLAIEHMAVLERLGDPHNFPEFLKPDKAIWDKIQGIHPKTAVLSYVMEGGSKLVSEFPAYVHEVYRQGEDATPLHLKIWLSHDDRKREGKPLTLKIESFKKVLMPAQHLLKKMDPDNTRSVADVLVDLQPLQDQYANLVVRNRPDLVPGVDIKLALKIYKSFHLLQKASTWGDIPVQCTCRECFKNCVCAHGVLFASLFDDTLRVPEEYIAATVGLRKKCRALKGAAGTKRKRLFSEIAAAKKKGESKIKFMKQPEGPKVARDASGSRSKRFVIPDADIPTTSDEEVFRLFVPHLHSTCDFHILQAVATEAKAKAKDMPTIDNDEAEVPHFIDASECFPYIISTAGSAARVAEGQGKGKPAQAIQPVQAGQPANAGKPEWRRRFDSRRTTPVTTISIAETDVVEERRKTSVTGQLPKGNRENFLHFLHFLHFRLVPSWFGPLLIHDGMLNRRGRSVPELARSESERHQAATAENRSG